jgi:hypothetical protein
MTHLVVAAFLAALLALCCLLCCVDANAAGFVFCTQEVEQRHKGVLDVACRPLGEWRVAAFVPMPPALLLLLLLQYGSTVSSMQR